jgi:Ser/Thr protein kinase RdoA (MazF antagonist)
MNTRRAPVGSDLNSVFLNAFLPVICECAGVEQSGRITELNPGRLNSVFHFMTRSGPVLLRKRDLIDPEYHQMPSAEHWCYPLLKGVSVHKPALIASNATGSDGVPFAWTMLEYVSGKRLDNYRPNAQFLRRLGADIAMIHSVQGPGFGKLPTRPDDCMQFSEKQGSDWLLSVFEREQHSLNRFAPALASRFLNYGIHWANRLRNDEDIHPCLVHGDLHARNIIVRRNTPYFLDWEAARFRPALSDLSKAIVFRLTDSEGWAEIARGYRDVGRLPSDWILKARVFIAYSIARQLGFEARYPTDDRFYPSASSLAGHLAEHLTADGF